MGGAWDALKALDYAAWRVRLGRDVYRRSGNVCLRRAAGHGVALRSHFPGRCWRAVAWVDNRVRPRVQLALRRVRQAVGAGQGGSHG